MRFLRSSSSKVIWVLVFIFLIFSMAIGTAGYFFFQNQKRHLVQEKRDHLRSIADLKVGQIHNWRQERFAEATVVLENPFIGNYIQEWLKSPGKIGLKKMISDWMVTQRKHRQYERVSLLDLKGTVRLSFPEGEEVLGPVTKRLASEAIREKRVILSEFYRGFNTGKIRLSLVVPILIRKGQDAFPVGVLLLRIDPDQFLYPLIQSWPTPSETSETLLVRRQGEEVEFLNELRHRKDTALSLRIPLSKKQVPAVMAVHGKETIEEGMDYRGAPVLAAMRRIPDSPWFIVAKVDQEEIYAPIRRSAWEIGIVTSLLIIGIGLSVGLASHQQRAQFYKRLYRAEQDRQALARHFDYPTKYANDIVLLMDENLNIIEANDRAVESYGCSREALQKMNLRNLQVSEGGDNLEEQKRAIDEQGAILYETLHQRKDRTTFPVESSSRVIEIEGRRFYQSIIRNITERKRAEEALRQAGEKYRSIFENAIEGIFQTTPEGSFLTVNPVLARMYGYSSPEEMIETITDIGRQVYVNPDERLEFLRILQEKGTITGLEVQLKRKDGSAFWASINARSVYDENGNILYHEGTSENITERKRAEEVLRENEVRYRELFENTNSGVAVYQVTGNGQDFIFKDFNRAGEKIDHDQRERLIGKSIFEVRPGVEQFGLIEVLRQVWQTGEPGYHPVTLYQDDQLSGWYENFVYKLPSGEIMVVFENVTERKRTEEALRQSEERFRSVFNNAFVGMAIVNPEGHVVEANEAFCRFLEYSREELIGRHFTECTHREDLNIDSDLYTSLLDDERLSYSIDKRYMRKGKVVWGRLSISLIKDEAGQLENTVVVREDITERKRAEEALRGSEEKYRLLVENANEAIFVVQEERLKFVNRKVSEIMGHTQEEITSRPFSDFIHPEDREMVLDNYLRGLRGETVPSTHAFRVIGKDGNARWVELGAVKIDWEGKPATLNLATDITERKRTEGEMELLQEQFRHSQKMEAVGRLAGGVAHDFNNLLTVIRGYSELCLGKLEEADPLWRKVKGIQRASEQGARLTSQLLAFSRHQVMEMKVINLNRLFKNLDRMLRRVIGEDIELVTILAEDLGGVKADLGQMEQVIMNLVVNARDAMPEGGKLTIEAKNAELDGVFFGSHAGGEPGRYVMFSVSDTGFGMTPEVKEHIFEPFFTTKGKGTGLGLSTVYGIVKQSGGEITVESEVGKGSAFLIYLPLVEGVMEDQKEEEQGAWGGKETVLVVEDEENVRRLVAEVLEGQGYEVLEASGGEEALQIMEGYGGRIDLILTDVVMPGISGRELGKRSVERWGMVKVLYMSGFFDEERVSLNVLEEGMNYVQKPFTVDALTRKVREVLDK